MITFSNQYDFRVDNQLKVISALQSGQKSLNDLADKLNISFTAISKIVNQMIDYNILKRVNKKVSTSKRGRVPVLVKINNSVGVTCAIDLSSVEVAATLNNLTGHVLAKTVVGNFPVLNADTFKQVSAAIKNMLELPEIENRKLLCVCISCPGLVDKNTGELVMASRLNTDGISTPNNFFFNEFGVPVILYNDAKIACFGEKVYGSIPKEAKNFSFFHIGTSVGAALVIGGKLYQGKNGFTGEFSNYTNLEGVDYNYKNRVVGLLELADYIIKKDPSKSILLDRCIIDYEKADQLYSNNDPLFLEALEDIAKQNALQFIAYNDFLDLEYIVIEGSILKYKEKYREYLNKYLAYHSRIPFRAKIIFSSLDGQASLKGSIYKANRFYFLNKLEEITNERASSGNYAISESFSDDI